MKRKLAAIAAAAVALIPLAGSPAHAGTVTGKLAFECLASLPEFPSDQATGSCGAPSAAAGTLSGFGDTPSALGLGEPYTLVAAGANNFRATFAYQEACLAGNEPPLAGRAEGEATITGLIGVKGGAPVTATASLQFNWDRVGTTAVVEIVPAGSLIEFSDGDRAHLTLAAGQATFAPVLTLSNACPAGGPVQAVVVGSAAFGA